MINKKIKIMQLISEIDEPLLEFLDIDSNKMLDKKINVLIQLKNGKKINEIKDFYDILEKDIYYHWD